MISTGLEGYEGRIPGTDRVGVRVRFYPPEESDCLHRYKLTNEIEWANAGGYHYVTFEKCPKCKVIKITEKIR